MPRAPRNPIAHDDGREDQVGQGPFYKWVLGTAVPIALLYLGTTVVIEQHVVYGRARENLVGVNAIASGVSTVSAAAFLHCHFFWGNLYDEAWPAVLGKIVSLCGFIGGIGFLLVRLCVLGIR